MLPFVFARSEQKFLTSGLPMLLGMATTFAGIATLAAVGGAWAVRLNQYGRLIAMLMLAAFAATLLSRRLADWMSRPFVSLGNRLIAPGSRGEPRSGAIRSLLLGVATGFLWAPCAGPILGLVLTGAALSGPSAKTTVLLFSYAAGAATSLAVAILAGGRLFAAMKRFLGAGEWVRRGLGIAVLLALVAIATGWDSGVLTRLSLAGTTHLEESLLNTVQAANDLAILLRAGALPAPLSVIEQRTVGPGLGQDSIEKGELAAYVGSILVILFMLLTYRLFGVFANIAVAINVAMIFGVLSLLNATLTLPGIAGVVLTVGIAVDSNVLIYERIREELRGGRNAISAIDAGFKRALSTILDSNITTFIAAAVLFYIGTGPVRGFAVTLGIGIVTTVFTAFTVTRLIVATWVRWKRPTSVPI